MDLSHLAIPIGVLYAGLAGTVLALIVATIQNKWSLRVFFILALRLAIGWHFLFEGLHKVHSYYIGPTETNRPFSSEPYFTVAEGPLGPRMRQQFGDVDEQLNARIQPQNLPESFTKLTADQKRQVGLASSTQEHFAQYAPAAVAEEWKRFVADFTERCRLTDAEKKLLDGTLDEQDKRDLEERQRLTDEDAKLARDDGGLQSREYELQRQIDVKPDDAAAKEELGKVRGERKKIAEERRAKAKRLAELALTGDLSVDALASYGRWVAGVEGRASKVKFVSGDVELSAQQRLEYIEAREKDLANLQKRAKVELGNSSTADQNRMRELKMLIMQSKAALLADADAFLLELKKNAFTTIIQARVSKQAPPPSAVFADPAKFEAILPPADAPPHTGFDKLPPEVQEVWNKYHATFKANYPESVAEAADHGFKLAKVRVANWYFGRDQYTGKSAKQEAEKALADAKAKADAANLTDAERAKLKAAVAVAEKDLERAAKLRTPFQTAVDRYRALGATASETQKQAAREAILKEFDARYADLAKTLLVEIPADVADWPTAVKAEKKGERLDRITQWFLVALGVMLLAGFGTRIACVLAGGFLVLTYLTHPPFPWLPQPPNTEGNPVFINKNVIEFLGLMVVLVHPTGRWMGLDALVHKIFHRNAPDPT